MSTPTRDRHEHDFACMSCPVWAVRLPAGIDRETGREYWDIDTLWFTAEEATQYIRDCGYRLPGAKVFGYPASGQLHVLLDGHTTGESA